VVRAEMTCWYTVANEKLDDSCSRCSKRRSHWTTHRLRGRSQRSLHNDPFVDQTYPARSRRFGNRAAGWRRDRGREAMLANNVPKMVAAGARRVARMRASPRRHASRLEPITTRSRDGWSWG
jgi:hypothetical protein